MSLLNKILHFSDKERLNKKVVDVLILSPIDDDKQVNDNNREKIVRQIKYRVIDGIDFEIDNVLMQMEQMIVEKNSQITQLKELIITAEEKSYGITNLYNYYRKENDKKIKHLEDQLNKNTKGISAKTILKDYSNTQDLEDLKLKNENIELKKNLKAKQNRIDEQNLIMLENALEIKQLERILELKQTLINKLTKLSK